MKLEPTMLNAPGRERERGGGVNEDQVKLIRTIKVGNVKLDDTHKTGTFKLKQEVKARPEFGTKSTPFDRKTKREYLMHWCLYQDSKSVFLPLAHAQRTRALKYSCRSPGQSI